MSKFSAIVGSRKSRKSSQKVQTSGRPEVQTSRQRGKKGNPEFVQVTSYLRRDTYIEARKRLFEDGREFSELVEDLVNDWLKASK